MQPGGPQGAGSYRGVPVVTLPGNPVSAAISFEMFVRPALRSAMGHRRWTGGRPVATLPTPCHRAGRQAAVPPRLLRRRPARSEPVGGPGSHLLGSLAVANCLFVVPEGVSEVAAGDPSPLSDDA